MNYDVGILSLKSMPIKYIMVLDCGDRQELKKYLVEVTFLRERQRAHRTILLDEGLTTKSVLKNTQILEQEEDSGIFLSFNLQGRAF